MEIVADESMERAVVDRLRIDGHSVVYIADFSAGIPDPEVLRIANEARAVLLTSDKDFGELVYRQNRVHSGVILVRLPAQSDLEKAETLSKAILDHGKEMVGNFTVISPSQIRIRHST